MFRKEVTRKQPVIVAPSWKTLSDFFLFSFFTFCLICIYYFHAKNCYIMQEK